ncbi:MAG TPA: hypothetical protein VN914_18650 [Polyangia bacterium]|nr:hypothetical protein [Polyangia bacterium]
MGPLVAAAGLIVAVPAAALDKATCDGPADVEALEAGQWCEVPGSHLAAPGVRPDPVPAGSQAQGVIAAWSGGAYDRKRDRLIVWGGGHMDYAGNEVYVFDLGTLRWSRASDPARNTGGNEPSGYYPSDDGTEPVDPRQPRARHTYNYVQYLDSLDRFCSLGGAALYPSGQTGTAHVDCFDFEARRWQALADTPSQGIGAKSAYDCRTGHVWIQGTVAQYGLSELDPAANRWTQRLPNDEDFRYSYGQTADIDPAARRMVAVGEKKVVVWNLADPTKVTRQYPALHGDVEILARPAPGLAYDFHARALVAWAGGTEVFTVEADEANAVVTRRPAAASNRVPATALSAAANGTFGRFRYVPSRNVFIVVNAIDANVFLYRYTAGAGAPADCQSGTAPPPVTPPPPGVDAGIDSGAAGAGSDSGPASDAAPPIGGTPTADAGVAATGKNGCGCTLGGRASGGLAVVLTLTLGLGFVRRLLRRRRRPGWSRSPSEIGEVRRPHPSPLRKRRGSRSA